VVWRVKTEYVQSRPIQEIRHRYFGTNIASWNSTTPIAAASWVPYQTASFVTPPFGDFCSGHSYFSRAFAQCMSRWFGNAVPASEVATSKAELVNFAPLFNSLASPTVPFSLHTIHLLQGCSEIQPGTVPLADMALTFTTWQQLASEVGMSRLYGGIHCITAHTASVALSNALYPMLQEQWDIAME
jgi:hypothetical protein